MNMINVEYDRLDAVARKLYGNINLLAEKLQMTASAIYTWKKRGIPLKADILLKEIGINPDYIRTGEGEMIIKKGETTFDPNKMFKMQQSLNDLIKQYDIKISSIYEMQEIKETMLLKIDEINKYLQIGG